MSSSEVPPSSASPSPLEEEFWETDASRIRRWFPWLHLFQAFRIAMDYRKILLAILAVVALAAGEWGFSKLPFAPKTFRTAWPWEADYFHPETAAAFAEPGTPAPNPTVNTRSLNLSGIPWLDLRVLRPYQDFITAGYPLISPTRSWGETATAWTKLLWLLIVTGLCGGVIARLAALNLSGKDCSLRSALRYCLARFASYLGAPLLPAVAIFLLWLLCAAGGLVASIPYLGAWLASALWFLPLIFGLMMAIILLGAAAGWPLMYATVSTEGSDAFDGLSRSYSYLFSRPWYALWLLFLTSLYGAALVLFLHFVLDFGAKCAFWGVGSGLGHEGLQTLVPSEFPSIPGEARRVPWAGEMTEFWMNGLRTIEPAFLFSFFWTAATISYVLLRRSVDATPIEAVDEDLKPSDEFPLVGVPAVERREAAAAPPPPPSAVAPAAAEAPAAGTELPPTAPTA